MHFHNGHIANVLLLFHGAAAYASLLLLKLVALDGQATEANASSTRILHDLGLIVGIARVTLVVLAVRG